MKRETGVVAINSVPLLKAVLCADCECISESRFDVCGVCGGRSLVNLGRLLRSAMQNEVPVATQVTEPLITRDLKTVVDSPSCGIHAVSSRSF